MNNADQKMTNRIESMTTEQLAEVSLRLTAEPTTEATIVCNRVERVLADRMSGPDFAAHMQACEAVLDAA